MKLSWLSGLRCGKNSKQTALPEPARTMLKTEISVYYAISFYFFISVSLRTAAR
jgi:hypothetical protein